MEANSNIHRTSKEVTTNTRLSSLSMVMLRPDTALQSDETVMGLLRLEVSSTASREANLAPSKYSKHNSNKTSYAISMDFKGSMRSRSDLSSSDASNPQGHAGY